jgi:hypothetical protein
MVYVKILGESTLNTLILVSGKYDLSIVLPCILRRGFH